MLAACGMAMVVAMMMLVVMVVIMAVMVPVIMTGHHKNVVTVVVMVVMTTIGSVDMAGLTMGGIGVGMGAMIMSAMLRRMAMVVTAMVIGAALGPEWPGDLGQGASLSADHLGKHMIILDIESIGGDLGGRVTVADMPGDTHQPQHVLGPHFQQIFDGGLHHHKPAIFKFQRIALVENRCTVEIEQKGDATLGGQNGPAPLTILMVEHDGRSNLFGLDGRLANDAGGAQHDMLLQSKL